VILPLSALVRHIRCAGPALGSQYWRDRDVTSAANGQAEDLELGLVEQSLRELGLVSLEKWRLRGILLMCLMGGDKKELQRATATSCNTANPN